MIEFFVRTMEVSGNQNCLVNSILQNIIFCVPQNKEWHLVLEQHGE